MAMHLYSNPPSPGQEMRDDHGSSVTEAQVSARHQQPSHIAPLASTPGSSSSRAQSAASSNQISGQPHPSLSPSSDSAPCPSKSLSRGSRSRRNTLPFSFPPLFSGPSNTSSTSLAPSIAEGRPIPLDDSVTANRTSALRQLNNNFPSPVNRHRYGKSTGAQNTTYSQPVIVRTYSGPSPRNPYSSSRGRPYRPLSSNRGGSRRIPLPESSYGSVYLTGPPLNPVTSGLGSDGDAGVGTSIDTWENESLIAMGRAKSHKSKLPLILPWQWSTVASSPELDEAKLPPLEAFSFKSIMADLQARGGESDISADLDRIAEICARSRYSLSNQYEVHMSPHGSGTAFLTGTSMPGNVPSQRRRGHRRGNSTGGPTLQAVSDDDENSAKTHRKRRSGGRRRSIAYGTLETIISSSRSSEEDKSKKKPAAEIADEVRGRAARKNTGNSLSSGSGEDLTENGASESPAATTTQERESTSNIPEPSCRKLNRKKSASGATALMEGGLHTGKGPPNASRSPSTLLVSPPSLPQMSTSHLEIRTAPKSALAVEYSQERRPSRPQMSDTSEDVPRADEPMASHGSNLFPGLSSWIPWTTPHSDESVASGSRSKPAQAEGSLRQLLNKGKAVDHGS